MVRPNGLTGIMAFSAQKGSMTDQRAWYVAGIVPRLPSHVVPTIVAAAGDRAALRFVEFFAANIRNPHTRRAYARAAGEFLAWCAAAGVPSVTAVRPVHVATWIEASTRELAAPSVKRRLAARNGGTDLKHVRAQHQAAPGIKVIGVILHKRGAALEPGGHYLHGPDQRTRLPVTFSPETKAVGHQTLRRNAGQLNQPVKILKGIGESFEAAPGKKSAQA